MAMDTEFHRIALNVDRGDGSELSALIEERNALLTIVAAKDIHINELLAQRDKLIDAVKPFVMAKPIPATIPPEQVLFKFGDWNVYLRDLLKLRVDYWSIKTP